MSSDLRLADLPATLHLLPLVPWLLLPETVLPVTVTDSHDLGVLAAALAAGGYVGVVQPSGEEGGSASGFYSVGCLARIHEEGRSADGLQVRLEGLVRFRIREELPPEGGVPRAAVGYGEFAADLAGGGPEPEGWKLEVFKDRIVEFGRKQFGSAGVLETMSPRQVVLFMAQTAPFSPAERQALLEARGFQDLIDTLAQLLSLNYLTTTPDNSPPSQVN
ncbi:MAG: LON peptidase substrate-binding domain-containing protein [Thermoanaerobaculia bacterium]